ncbi:MAG: hypothetical protein ACM3PX_10500 [Omnitrophica WOR_2 bacterium]
MKARLSILLLITFGLSITSCVSLKQSNYPPVANLSHKSFSLKHERGLAKEKRNGKEDAEIAIATETQVSEYLRTLNDENVINPIESKSVESIVVECREYTTMKDVREIVLASSVQKITAPFKKNQVKVADTEYKIEKFKITENLPSFNAVSGSGLQQGYSIVSFIAGILGLFVAALPLGIVAIIFGTIGVRKSLRGLAIAGLILGIIDVLAIILYVSAYSV